MWEAELLHLAELMRTEYGLPAVAGSGEKLDLEGKKDEQTDA